MAIHPSSLGAQSRSGAAGRTPTTGTATQIQTNTRTQPILVLRAERAETRHIQWAEDVVDNEGMGKKSSKVCCIYHKPHSAGESSEDDSSSDESSDSDSEPDNSKARPAGGSKRGRNKNKKNDHDHDHDHTHDHANCGDNGEGSSKARRPSPNAYERMPNYKPREGGSANPS